MFNYLLSFFVGLSILSSAQPSILDHSICMNRMSVVNVTQPIDIPIFMFDTPLECINSSPIIDQQVACIHSFSRHGKRLLKMTNSSDDLCNELVQLQPIMPKVKMPKNVKEEKVKEVKVKDVKEEKVKEVKEKGKVKEVKEVKVKEKVKKDV